MAKKPSLDAAFAAATAPSKTGSYFDEKYPELVPYVIKWLEARKKNDGTVVRAAAAFHKNFMVPNGYKETISSFRYLLHSRFADLWSE